MIRPHALITVGLICAGLVTSIGDRAAAGTLKVAVVGADTQSGLDGIAAALASYPGLAPITSADEFDSSSITPTLADLSGYDVILAYTNFGPLDAAALGDVLGDLVDLGKGVVLAEYGIGDYTTPIGDQTGFQGKITGAGYSPLVVSNSLGDVDGTLTPIVPADGIFTGVNLAALTYYHDSNFAQPMLDPGATLLATDGTGVNMIARSASGRVIAMNFFPSTDVSKNNEEFYTLLGNALTNVAPVTSVPEPGTFAAAILGALLAVFVRTKSRAA